MNINEFLIRNSIKFKKKNAIIYNEQIITYQELLILVNFYSKKFLREYKIKSNSRISVLMDNCIEYILIILIACKLNFTVQTLGTYYSKNLIKSRLKKFNPQFIFTKKYLQYFFSDKNKKKVKTFDYNKKIILIQKKQKKNSIKKGFNKKLLAVDSSGTTGSSKTLIFSENCKIQRSISAKKEYNLNSNDIFIVTAPFDHSVGHRQIFLPIILGSTNIILKNFHPKIWLDNVKKYKVSFSLLISTQITKILETIKLKKKDVSSLNNLISVSTKLHEKDKRKLLKFKINLHEMYGTSEIATATSINLKSNYEKSNSIGKPLKGYKIKIIKDNRLCKPGEIGEIICYSPNLFEGYFKSKLKKKEIFYQNYFKTGDYGYLDNDGYLYYTGRKKNLVKISGLSVYPEEIEKKISKYFNSSDFIITGTKSSLGNETLIMFVEKISKNKLIELKYFLKTKLEKYEIPQKIINIKKFPRTNLGKINLSKLKHYQV